MQKSARQLRGPKVQVREARGRTRNRPGRAPSRRRRTRSRSGSLHLYDCGRSRYPVGTRRGGRASAEIADGGPAASSAAWWRACTPVGGRGHLEVARAVLAVVPRVSPSGLVRPRLLGAVQVIEQPSGQGGVSGLGGCTPFALQPCHLRFQDVHRIGHSGSEGRDRRRLPRRARRGNLGPAITAWRSGPGPAHVADSVSVGGTARGLGRACGPGCKRPLTASARWGAAGRDRGPARG